MKTAALLYLLLAFTAIGACLVYCGPWAKSPQPSTEPLPFVELEEVIAREGWDPRWEIHVRPDKPGPYRRVGGSISIAANPLYWSKTSYRTDNGQLIAPLELRGTTDYEQLTIHLETADGQITGAILKRDPTDD
jgi:hypothetical protein